MPMESQHKSNIYNINHIAYLRIMTNDVALLSRNCTCILL